MTDQTKSKPTSNTTSDRKKMVRQWIILSLLDTDGPGLTYKELATKFNTDTKTITRDIQLLRDVGFPLYSTNLPRGEKLWRRVAGLIPSINLSFSEAAALYLSRRMMEPLAGTELWGDTQQVFQKFEGTFSKKMVTYLNKLAQAFHCTKFGTKNYSSYNKLLNDLLIAIRERRVTTISYQSQQTTEPAERDVHPYHLVYHRGSLYLVAWAEERKRFQNYKIDRISSVVIDSQEKRTAKSKEKQAPIPFEAIEFDLQEYLAGSFGIFQSDRPKTKVRIRFQPQVVRYLAEKFWHDSQKLINQPDGTTIAEFILSDFHEVKSWILSFGPNAQVLEPPELITEIKSDLIKMSLYYQETEPIVSQKRKRV